ncbi:MAG: tRNA (adenosine(37)-N6)-dimethylallyltransferase MiaA [Bacteroidetes bacterium]|nr:tRNA (adenosine(37)-N6)-dimethylallyltransferase MiaA [Bacteroidota bacterium]
MITSFESEGTLVVVGGATASGKTGLAIELAKYFQTEIISADSRQFYSELNIGVARPEVEELQAIKHHFIADRSVEQELTAGEFAREALPVINRLLKEKSFAILVGGSGLYIKALTNGFHPDFTNSKTRSLTEEIFQQDGLSGLQNHLKKIDPEAWLIIDQQNPHRLMRAIERVESSGLTHAELRKENRISPRFRIIELGIDWQRDLLYKRIENRVDRMIESGLKEEVESVKQFRNLRTLQTVGYKEIFNYFDGKTDWQQTISGIKQNTRRYAKRQLTWFRNQHEIIWLDPENAVEQAIQKTKELSGI